MDLVVQINEETPLMEPVDLNQVKTVPLTARANKVGLGSFARPPRKGRDYVTVNMDMIAHYRGNENVVRQPAVVAGRGYTLIGRHEIIAAAARAGHR